MSQLFIWANSKHGQQLSHVRAWRRHKVAQVKTLWNQALSVKVICTLLDVNEDFVDHSIRGNICPDAGPVVVPRRSFGRNQKARLREIFEVPG